jgi:periplasmic protein TonB
MKARTAYGVLLSRRTCTFGVILAAHGAIVYAMADGFPDSSEILLPAIQAKIISQPRPLMRREAIPEPTMKRLRIEIPPPEIEVDLPAEQAITDVAIGTFAMEKEAPPPPSGHASKPAARHLIRARVGEDFPNADAFYPPASIRREEQGLVSVQVCIGLDGRLIEAPALAKTSGSARLDEAALKLARSGHYLAGSVDGTPVVDCLQLPIRFRLKH